MKFYLYPGINLENQAMPPKQAHSVDPLAAVSNHPSDYDIHFLFALKITDWFTPLNMLRAGQECSF